LDISDNGLLADEAIKFLQMVFTNKELRLTWFDCSSNPGVGAAGYEQLKAMLRPKGCSWAELRKRLRGGITPNCMQIMVRSL
jgi:hypothetical protein